MGISLTQELTPLYVDLDGTFIKSDMLLESLFSAIKSSPWVIIFILPWLCKGRAFLKMRLSDLAQQDVLTIPTNPQTYQFLTQQKTAGRRIILATASNEKIAKAFVSAYPIFDDYIASNAIENLKGRHKLHKIQAITPEFSYMGNSIEDYVLFEHATESYLVAPTRAAKRKTFTFTKMFDQQEKSTILLLLKELRVYQWVKNLLIFVPLFVSNAYTDMSLVLACVVGFLAFSLLASATYVLNDLVDLDADRIHQHKKHRPLASGDLSIFDAVVTAVVLLFISAALALSASVEFSVVLLVYLALTLSYSLKLKRYFAMDVIALASLYTIRIFAGAAIMGIAISFWLLSFSMFVFLSLALIKRCAELVTLKNQAKEQVSGRDYGVEDLSILSSFGTSSSLLSVLMYCFYINNDSLTSAFQEPDILWLSIPALGYWLMRMWVKTIRGEMHDDPIVFSLMDRGSIFAIGFIGLVTLAAQLH